MDENEGWKGGRGERVLKDVKKEWVVIWFIRVGCTGGRVEGCDRRCITGCGTVYSLSNTVCQTGERACLSRRGDHT